MCDSIILPEIGKCNVLIEHSYVREWEKALYCLFNTVNSAEKKERRMRNLMRNKLVALLVISLMTILVAYVPSVQAPATTWGPKIEHIRYPTYLSPDAQTLSMQRRDTEFLTDLIRPMDVETLRTENRKVYGTPYDHFCYIAFNLKCWWLGPMDGTASPGRALRHAISHLVPKDELIGTLFKYIVTKIEASGPPAQGEWYNSNVDPHTYDPVMAYNVLTTGGWTWDAGQGRWELAVPFEGYPAGTPMPTTTLYSPEFETAPTSWEIMRTTVARMTGAAPFDTKPLPGIHEPIDFNVLLDTLDFEPARSLSHDDGGWDAYFLCYSDLGSTARFLVGLHHSSQDIEEGDNTMHLHNAAVDAQLDIINTSLDHVAKVAAAQEAYRLLHGSVGLQYTPTTDGIIARIPIYSRSLYAGIDEGLDGIVEMLLTGVDNGYTFSEMYWPDPSGHESDIVKGGTDTKQVGYMVKFCNQEPLQTPLNPAYASSAYTWFVMDYIYDSLIRTNPYTNRNYAWILDETKDPDYPNTPGYYVEPWGDGMKVTYWMVDEEILWHDGHPIDAFDLEFAWDYQKENTIGQWWETFMYYSHADVIDVPTNRTIVAYITDTSQFIPLTMAGMGLCFPEHIWGCTHERGGRATPSCDSNEQTAYTDGVTPVTVESGICICTPGPAKTAPEKTTCIHGCGCVIDNPGTPQNEVYAYDPSYYAHPNAPAAFPWLTELVGSGEFIFYGYNPTAMVSDIIAFDSTRTGAPGSADIHYWKTTAQLEANLADLFWEAADCDRSGTITTPDHIIMSDAMGYWGPRKVPPEDPPWSYYDEKGDVTEDNLVGLHDAIRLGKNFGKTRTT